MERDVGKSCGGSDPSIEYKKVDTIRSCDKIAHLLRSIFWQPNHLKNKRNKERVKKIK